MSISHMSRWIETAEIRFYELAMSERPVLLTETQHLHLGDRIAKVGASLFVIGSRCFNGRQAHQTAGRAEVA